MKKYKQIENTEFKTKNKHLLYKHKLYSDNDNKVKNYSSQFFHAHFYLLTAA